MTDSIERVLERPQLELRTCPSCRCFVPLSHTDIRKNQLVRIYVCRCGKQFSEKD
jgi:hypothetical protein